MDRNQRAVHCDTLSAVALRKESVDRNIVVISSKIVVHVALRKESVDRNYEGCFATWHYPGRSPQGERG